MAFGPIFEYTDEDDDTLKVRKCQDYTIFRAEGDTGGEVEVRLRRENVTALHTALGEWLELKDPMSGHIAEDSLMGDLITRRVAEEVARVLPLHLSPLAFKSDAERAREADPEPGDVGHPVEPEHEECPCDHRPGVRQPSKYEDASAHPVKCGVCGRPWTDEHGQPGDPCNPQGPYPVEMRTASAAPTWDDKLWGPAGEPPQAGPRPKPYCDECLHSWARHPGGGLGCNAVRTAESGRPYCGCKQVRP